MPITFENENDVIVYAFEKSRQNVTIIPDKVPGVGVIASPVPEDNPEDLRQDQVLKECEEFLRKSRNQREIANLKALAITKTGRINPLKATKESLRVSKKSLRKKDRFKRKQASPIKSHSKLGGIDEEEIQRRKAEGECLRCAWPSDRKGTHRVKDCLRPIKLDKGTAGYPKAKELEELFQRQEPEEDSSQESSSSDDSS